MMEFCTIILIKRWSNDMKVFSILKFIIPVLLLIGTTAWLLDKNKTTQAQQIEAAKQTTTPSVQVVPVQRQSFQGSNEFIGKTEFLKEVLMTATTQGIVKEVFFKLNGSITEGASLLKVDMDLSNATIEIAQTNLEKAKRDLVRLEFLKAENNITGAEVENARLQVQTLENQIYQLKRQAQDALVKSPISGIITEKSIEKGMFIAPGTPLATITDVSSVKVKVFVPEMDLAKWTIGSNVQVAFEMYPNQMFTGKINYIGIKGGEAGRFPVEVLIPNSAKNPLRVGMTTRVSKSAQSIQNQLVIPRSALNFKEGNTPFVFTHENGKVVKKTVEVGQNFDNLVVILRGLSEGEKVVVSGADNIVDGQMVNIN
jgi:RND family efflux transporter MFP subunit